MMKASPSPEHTHARRSLLGLVFALAVITYLDRLCISAAMPQMAAEFNLTPDQKGWIFSAFTFAYAAFEIPSGWLGDRFGARMALTRIVLWWSAFTMLTGAAFGFWSLLIIRFLFGAGEAGAFPNIARAVSRWFPEREQGRAMSVSFVGLAAGSTVTAPVVLTLLQLQSWRWVFVEFGIIGALWCVAWRHWFRDLPEEHPAVNEAELKLIRAGRNDQEPEQSQRIPWKTLLTSANLAFICLMYFAYGYGLYFYITWLPTYLLEARGFSVGSTKWLAAAPWMVSAPAFWIGGWTTDWLARRTGNLKLARCGIGVFGYAASAVALFAVARVDGNRTAALLLALALGFQTFTIGPAWAVCLDVGRKYAGVVTGCMNTVGNIGGAIAPLVVGYAVKSWRSWTLPFYIMAAMFVFGMAMWMLLDPRKSALRSHNATEPQL
ncbi:MAG TPA: MFS transporter [Blastocatellia bacterium]|jgi:MFS family permease|nr:MFS transporter [Blastocatellia bacterium]